MSTPDEQDDLSRKIERISELRRRSAQTAKELEDLTRRIELRTADEVPPPDTGQNQQN